LSVNHLHARALLIEPRRSAPVYGPIGGPGFVVKTSGQQAAARGPRPTTTRNFEFINVSAS
jgi:hypothetical protein